MEQETNNKPKAAIEGRSEIIVYADGSVDIHVEGSGRSIYYGLAQYIADLMERCDEEGVRMGIRMGLAASGDDTPTPTYDATGTTLN